MGEHDITYAEATAGALSDALAAGTVSAVELLDAAVARIEAADGPINAVVVRDFERALTAAKAADAALARGERGALLGVPMTVKEAHNVQGLPTTWGSPAATAWIAPEDSLGVSRLKAAGAIIMGKTNVPPFLADWQSDNPVYGRTNHPLDPTRTPGGSSGGSAAALAAGMTPLEFGSDIGGSIRVPSAFCGVYGHKPSYGIVPQRGHAPLGFDGAEGVLSVIGPMARSAGDLALALRVLAGPDPMEGVGYRLDLPPPRHGRLADFRVLIIDHHPAAALDAEIGAALDRVAGALDRAGAAVSRRSNLLPDLAQAHEVYVSLLMPAMSRGPVSPPDLINAHGWMTALDRQMAIRRQWGALFENFDVVLAPVMGVVAFPHDASPFNDRIHVINGQATPYGAQLAWPGMATLAHLPATAFPVGLTKAGLPIGLQAIGPYLEDYTTIALAGLMAGL